MEVVVELKAGKLILMKPNAGVRNRALEQAETEKGYSQVKFLTTLIPQCVKEHPFGKVPIKDALDALDPDEYDKIVDKLRSVIKVNTGDIEKKSEQP